MTARQLDQTSRSLYEAAAHRMDLAGAALAQARARKIRALADLEAAEDEWMAAAGGLREHEAAPGIPAYTQVQPLNAPRIPPAPGQGRTRT
jgi:hypothetical protein